MLMPLPAGTTAATSPDGAEIFWELLGGRRQADARAADAIPWAMLIRKHERRVVVALLARGVQLERAKELTQEAWLRLMERHRAGKLRRLQLPGVAIKQAIFLAKDQSRRQRRQLPLASLAEAACHCDVERQIFAREELRSVERVVARCSPRARRVFQLMHGRAPKTQAEIADVLGISLQRVRQIACELRKRIRTELEASHD